MSWLPAIRIARREAVRAKGRSVLIVAMVALPVFGIGGADILLRSAQLEPDERVTRELGRTQARLTVLGPGANVIQPPDPDRYGAMTDGPGSGTTSEPEIPAGYRQLVSREGELSFRTAAGEAPLYVNEIDVGDPAFEGKFTVEAGRAPTGAEEIAVSGGALERLGVEVGGLARLVESERRLRVVGVVASAGAPPATVYARPGALLPVDADSSLPTIYLAGREPVTWKDVLRLNEGGLLVFSRHVVLDPPPRSEVPYFDRAPESVGQAALTTYLGIALLVVLAVAEVVLLAGAAFAVGARRQARSLGLVTAAGGEARDVRRIVLAGGLVLGIVGAVVGLVLAVVLSAVAIPLLERWTTTDFGRFDLRALELGGALLVGLVSALLAAVLPARSAARRDPVEALTGRRGQVRTPRKVPAAGLALVALGIAAAAIGSLVALSNAAGVNPAGGGSALLPAGLIGGGAAFTQLGLIVCSPAIVGLGGRLARRLPLPLRLALTDASRHRGRSAPAVAAVLAAVTGATALALVAASFDQRDRANYSAAWPEGTAGMMLEEFTSDTLGQGTVALADPGRAAAAVESDLPPFRAVSVRSEPSCDRPDGCAFSNPVLPDERTCVGDGAFDAGSDCDLSRIYTGGALPQTPVGDADLLRLLAGRAPAEAIDALESGGVVVLDPRYVVDGNMVVERSSAIGDSVKRFSFPAVVVETARPLVLAVYSEAVARKLGQEPAPTHLLLDFDELPTTEQEDAARASLRSAGFQAELTVERGYRSDYGGGLLALVLAAAVITLGAAGIATGLAQADSRADHATLAAVGATPRLRRTLAASQALAVAGLGTVLGVFAGLVPGLAFIWAVAALELAIPWLTLVEVLIGIPLVAALSAWLLTRSRLPLERRVAL